MTNRSRTTTPESPDRPDLDSLPLIRTTRARVPIGWPGGEPDSVRAACDAELAKGQRGGQK